MKGVNDVINNIETIAKNLRMDDTNYKVFSAKIKGDVYLSSVQYTDDVWGEYDAPVNKTFSRRSPQNLRLVKGDEIVIVKGVGCDTGATIIYVTCRKDEWYFMRGREAEDFLKNTKKIKSV